MKLGGYVASIEAMVLNAVVSLRCIVGVLPA